MCPRYTYIFANQFLIFLCQDELNISVKHIGIVAQRSRENERHRNSYRARKVIANAVLICMQPMYRRRRPRRPTPSSARVPSSICTQPASRSRILSPCQSASGGLAGLLSPCSPPHRRHQSWTTSHHPLVRSRQRPSSNGRRSRACQLPPPHTDASAIEAKRQGAARATMSNGRS